MFWLVPVVKGTSVVIRVTSSTPLCCGYLWRLIMASASSCSLLWVDICTYYWDGIHDCPILPFDLVEHSWSSPYILLFFSFLSIFINVAGLPPLLEGVACALGLWWWIKDSTHWILIYFDDRVYSWSTMNGLIRGLYTRGLCTRGCCAKGLYNIWWQAMNNGNQIKMN